METAATFDTEEVADTILNEVRRHSSQDAPADDQSLLVVRIGEPPSELPRARAEIIRIEETSDQLEASIWNAQGIGNELDTKLRPRIVSWVGNDRPAFANRIWVATVGVGVSALLRLAMARFWDQELFFTSSLTWYVHSADGLLTRRQGTDVVPSNVATL